MVKVFASHDWGAGGATHDRVRVVVKELRSRRIDVWFDETNMKGNIMDAMCRGIDACDSILVFVTRDYIAKVDSGDDADNVRREFMYAANCKKHMIPVRFDEDLKAPWTGPVGMMLGTTLYFDLVTPTYANLDQLCRAIRFEQGPPVCKPKPAPIKKLFVKERVAKALEKMGDEMRPGEHAVDALDRLLKSLAGSVAVNGKPFHAKLECVERELGI